MFKEILCRYCEKPFLKTGTRSLYCSNECFEYWHLEHPKFKNIQVFEKICKECKKTYQTTSLNGKFCSNSCSSKFNGRAGKVGGDKVSLKSFIKVYGLDVGAKKYKKFRENLSNAATGKTYSRKATSEETKAKIVLGLKNSKRFQTQSHRKRTQEERNRISESVKGVFTLDWFIKKFGVEIGKQKHKERSENISRISYFRIYNKQENKKNYSKISQEFCWKIYNKLNFPTNEKIYFAELNHEHSCFLSHCNFDFVNITRKKFIEFHGDKFHANPLFYCETDKPNPYTQLTAEQIWQFDKTKHDIAISKGFEGLIIWEHDYKNNQEREIQKCLDFLNIC